MLQLVRYPDWAARLHAALLARRRTPHQWGQFDCALCAADLVAAMTGEDFGARWRGTYSTEEEAETLLKMVGWGDLAGLADAHLPRRLERPRRGDVVLADGLYGPFLAVVAQAGQIAGPTARGVGLTPIGEAKLAWSVG